MHTESLALSSNSTLSLLDTNSIYISLFLLWQYTHTVRHNQLIIISSSFQDNGDFYYCVCPVGYVGSHCESPPVITESCSEQVITEIYTGRLNIAFMYVCIKYMHVCM